jgi:hypothetical protein
VRSIVYFCLLRTSPDIKLYSCNLSKAGVYFRYQINKGRGTGQKTYLFSDAVLPEDIK